ncbi:MAG: hypothetical protein ACI9QC_000093 [Oceanicoccus sp.]|jgi:hypothetical protein
MSSKNKTFQTILTYGGIGLFLLLMGFGVISAIMNTPDAPALSATEPVHWHAEISYEACGNPVVFDDEQGHTLTHGHNDGLVHVEGIVLDEKSVTLSSFFKNSDINISAENFEDYNNGDQCNFSSGPGAVSIYVDDILFTDPEEVLIKDGQIIRVIFD